MVICKAVAELTCTQQKLPVYLSSVSELLLSFLDLTEVVNEFDEEWQLVSCTSYYRNCCLIRNASSNPSSIQKGRIALGRNMNRTFSAGEREGWASLPRCSKCPWDCAPLGRLDCLWHVQLCKVMDGSEGSDQACGAAIGVSRREVMSICLVTMTAAAFAR